MIVEVVAVGTELLLGQIVNTNLAFIGAALAEAGFDSHFQTVVGDNEGRIASAITAAVEVGPRGYLDADAGAVLLGSRENRSEQKHGGGRECHPDIA